MTVAELFVNLGIKGNTKVAQALTTVQGGLEKTAELSFAAKAGIIGAVIAMEELTRKSMEMGADLKNFAIATGLSTDQLQKWNQVAALSGVSTEDLMGDIKNLQKVMVDIMLGKGVPPGFMMLGITPSRDPFKMLDQIREKIKGMPTDVARSLTSGLISEKMFVMLRSGRGAVAEFAKSMSLSPIEIDKLDKLNQKWATFWLTFKTDWGKIIADLSGPIGDVVTILTRATNEFTKIIKELDSVVSRIDFGAKLKPLMDFFNGKKKGDGRAVFGPINQPDEEKQYRDTMKNLLPKAWAWLTHNSLDDAANARGMSPAGNPATTAAEQEQYKQAMLDMLMVPIRQMFGGIMDQKAAQPAPNVNQNTTIHVHGDMDKDAANEVVKQRDLTNAYFQSPALNQR